MTDIKALVCILKSLGRNLSLGFFSSLAFIISLRRQANLGTPGVLSSRLCAHGLELSS
jgi:hypothetical protein